MIVRVTLNCQVKTGLFQAMYPFLQDNLPHVRGFKGNRRVSLFYDEERNELLLDEDWSSVESHKLYLLHIAENGVLQKLQNFLASPPDVKYFQMVDL